MKKKLMLLTTFIFVLLIGVCSVGKKEVRAAGESCETYHNYYMLLDSTSKGWFNRETPDSNGVITRTTSKIFSLGVPREAKIVDKGFLTISDTSTNGDMSFDEFYEDFTSIESDDYPYVVGRNSYIKATEWYDAEGTQQTTSSPMPNLSRFIEGIPSSLNMPTGVGIVGDEQVVVPITRTWEPDDIPNFEDEREVVYSPAVYHVEYQLCEAVEEKYTLTINFGTNKTCTEGTDIKSPVTLNHSAGDNVSYAIPNELGDYAFSEIGKVSVSSLVTTVKNGALSFNMPSQDTNVCLVYVKGPQTGLGWIYFAWIVAIGALGYSVWYFIKYSKTRNSEV